MAIGNVIQNPAAAAAISGNVAAARLTAALPGRSLMVKKNDGIKESTDSTATIDDEDTKESALKEKGH
ncbi:hypothetical protein KUTeg_003320 [Tegillarca granosa]|uniref:Uncharacterized protein n=1 Tax=Tegillarca granosa TaxID=220873 RepID=A0ABQ9FLU8_TEGGR|nr:hypothetical protein KUTeg_003320 [Tegillarca granosa]